MAKVNMVYHAVSDQDFALLQSMIARNGVKEFLASKPTPQAVVQV